MKNKGLKDNEGKYLTKDVIDAKLINKYLEMVKKEINPDKTIAKINIDETNYEDLDWKNEILNLFIENADLPTKATLIYSKMKVMLEKLIHHLNEHGLDLRTYGHVSTEISEHIKTCYRSHYELLTTNEVNLDMILDSF